MKHYTTTKGFCPHQISTKIGSINLYRYTHDIDFVCRRYHISKASLMRWNKIYDGTRESLIPKSHKPHSTHPFTSQSIILTSNFFFSHIIDKHTRVIQPFRHINGRAMLVPTFMSHTHRISLPCWGRC